MRFREQQLLESIQTAQKEIREHIQGVEERLEETFDLNDDLKVSIRR